MQSKPPEESNIIKPVNITVRAPAAVRIRCRTRQNPVIQPTMDDWLKDGKKLNADDIATGRISSSMGQLVIKSTSEEDSGTYTCILRNSAGDYSVSANVTVEGETQMNRFEKTH